MKDYEVLGAGAFLISWLPIHLDPFYHQERVNFWEWLRRELYELQYGEQAKLMYALHMGKV